jgi:hypothetical protein
MQELGPIVACTLVNKHTPNSNIMGEAPIAQQIEVCGGAGSPCGAANPFGMNVVRNSLHRKLTHSTRPVCDA